MALTIPYSGSPERPRRSNYPLNGGFVSQKTLIRKCKRVTQIYLLTYSIHNFLKKSTGNLYKIKKKLQNKSRNTVFGICFANDKFPEGTRLIRKKKIDI